MLFLHVLFHFSIFCVLSSTFRKAIIASTTFLLLSRIEIYNEVFFDSTSFRFISIKDRKEDVEEILRDFFEIFFENFFKDFLRDFLRDFLNELLN